MLPGNNFNIDLSPPHKSQHPHRNTRIAVLYKLQQPVVLVLTFVDVHLAEFCRAICKFHGFTFPSVVGTIVPFAWDGNSQNQCPGYCAYPFAVPSYMKGVKAAKPPNEEVGLDGIITIIAHELAEIATDSLTNMWFSCDSLVPTEIVDLCEGIYGSGGGWGYIGQVLMDQNRTMYNLFGVAEKKLLVQWIWSPVLSSCFGPNASK